MHQGNGTSYPIKFEILTQSRVLKNHLRLPSLLNLVIITDHCFYRFLYMALVLIFPFFLIIVNIIEYGCKLEYIYL